MLSLLCDMQVPDKNASMESLVSTLILSGILPVHVLTLAASLCTNHSLYYQGCTNLPQTASLLILEDVSEDYS